LDVVKELNGNDGSRDLAQAIADLGEQLPAALAPLADVAYNYSWAWRPGVAQLFREIDEATWRRVGVKANLTVPMTVGGRIEGAIAIASFRRERHWPGELVSRLRILAEVFGNALAYKRARESLDSAMRFERLVSEMLAALLTTDRADDRNRVIEAGLRDMALFLGAERATLWERIGTSPQFRKTHRWLAAGVPVPPDRAGGVAIPWINAQIVAGSVVRFASYADLPPEAAADLPALRELGVRSLVSVPLRSRAPSSARCRSRRCARNATGPRRSCRESR